MNYIFFEQMFPDLIVDDPNEPISIADYIIVDDIQDYDEIREGWYYGADTWSSSELFLWKSVPVHSDQSMKYLYRNYGPD